MSETKQTVHAFAPAGRHASRKLEYTGNLAIQPLPSPAVDLGDAARLAELDVRLDAPARILWQHMKPAGRPSFTMGLLSDMRAAQRWVQSAFADAPETGEAPMRYVVMASRMPGIFNLGGDLPLFVELIRAKDRAGLRRYAHACIDVQHARAINMDTPVVSISLVQGDALGGGFECALAADVIVAEKSAKFGLPEILFNLFPGMGAYSLLGRRIGPARAEEMILSGRIYSAEELKAMDVVDVVAADGQGEEAVYQYVEERDRSFNAHRAVYKVRRMVNPVSHRELLDVTDLWVETALTLENSDLRKMERLAAAQDRRWAAISG